MRSGRGVSAVVLLALLAGAHPADAAICRVSNGYQNVEYPCPDGSSGGGGGGSGPWYADQQVQGILAIVGLLGSAGAAVFTVHRVRARRRALTQHLATLERTYQEAKASPTEGAPRIAALRRAIEADHRRGRLDDGQFLEMDKRAKEYLVRLRLLDVDVRFRELPPAFLVELRHLVGDGVVSQAEADLIEHHAAAFAVAEPARSEIVRLARAWAAEDDPAAGASRSVPVDGAPEPIPARPRPRILTK